MNQSTTDDDNVIHKKLIRVPFARGQLHVVQTLKGDTVVSEVFTLASLAMAMDMSMAAMNGRYVRAQLRHWNVPVVTGSGRPHRGFPMALLDDVVRLIETKGATLSVNGTQTDVTTAPRTVGELVPEYKGGEKYLTVEALATGFSLAPTTIRRRLMDAGIYKRFEPLRAHQFGGRPKLGIHERHWGDIMLVLQGDTLRRDMRNDPVEMARVNDRRREAATEMRSAVAPHTPPPGIRSFDADTLAPVVPLRGAVPAREPLVSQETIDALAADIEATLAGTTVPSFDGMAGGTIAANLAAQRGSQGATALNGVNSEGDTMEQMRAMQIEALAKDPDEPSDEELDDTADMLGLTGDDAESFKAEVRRLRAEIKGENHADQ